MDARVPYVCEVCAEQFAWTQQLTQHEETAHPPAEVEADEHHAQEDAGANQQDRLRWDTRRKEVSCCPYDGGLV